MIHLIEAGHSYKVHGLKGDLIVDLNPQLKKHILITGVVFIKLEGNPVPFFIESVKGTDELIVKFKEVDSPESARELSNQVLYIDDLGLAIEKVKIEEPGDEINSLLHFQLEDIVSGFKGIIKDIEEFPGQIMALVEINSKQVMIPIHEDWIVEIDEKEKIIRVKLPEGLLDL
jgi:16S rRNA processing protein RimM